jgi:DNA-directed RNA polymerase subunit beta'
MGHLIPAGTGFPAVREIKLVELGEQVGTSLMDEPDAQPALG